MTGQTSSSPQRPPLLKNPVLWAFVVCFVYWIFLFASTRMVIIFDADQYKNDAQMINSQGLDEFFRNGPFNEPLYPLIISLSMRLADHFSTSYQSIQTIVQLLVFFLSWLLVLKLLQTLKLNPSVSALTVLYFGISPALLNSALSLWSEIITYPFVLGIVLTAAKGWQALSKPDGQWKGQAILLGAIFGSICYVKAIFEFIFILFLIPFGWMMFRAFIKKDHSFLLRTVYFTGLCVLVFQLSVLPLKFLNSQYNGQFVLAGRGPYILYGNSVKRTEPLTKENWLAAAASIPGEGVCRHSFSKETCDYWTMKSQDEFGLSKTTELEHQGKSKKEINQVLMSLAKHRVMSNPVQYFILTALESFKVFFWESTKIGFVIYPPTLESLYDSILFKNGLRLFLAGLTFIGFFLSSGIVFTNRKKIFSGQPGEELSTLLFMNVLILAYTAMYSLSTIHTRYAFPLVPLFLSLIGYHVQNILNKKQSSS